MAVQERKSENTFDRYIAEVRATWGDGKAPDLPFKIKSLMEKLFAQTSPEDPWMDELIREGKPSRELYRDPDHGFIRSILVEGEDKLGRKFVAQGEAVSRMGMPIAGVHGVCWTSLVRYAINGQPG